jgi:glycosyltransferase involved in cell wall biosynthesis
MLSIVLAVYNEEKNIKLALDSDVVRNIANEIIVVDGSSTDKTREIAKKLGARVIKTTNKPNFHINKQMAMDEAKGDLVLQLDADEVVDKKLGKFVSSINKKIEELKKDDKDWAKNWKKTNPVAWKIPRKNLFLGSWLKKGGQYPDPVIRLYINGYAKLPQKDVHEQMKVDGNVGWAKGHFLHYANPTFSDYLRKFNTYTKFKAQQLDEAKTKVSFANGITYIIFKPLKTFLQLFVRHRGYVDGIPGFVFAAMSGFHHLVAYLILWEIKEKRKKKND